ncbi:MAG TPA: hypothetical protein V6C82_07105 [Chroococcales cyanobacterium]
MEMFAVRVERDRGNAFCGTASYRQLEREGRLLWTVELLAGIRKELRVEVFPCEDADCQVVAAAEESVVESILAALGRHALPLVPLRC